jgi:hypothetical protein
LRQAGCCASRFGKPLLSGFRTLKIPRQRWSERRVKAPRKSRAAMRSSFCGKMQLLIFSFHLSLVQRSYRVCTIGRSGQKQDSMRSTNEYVRLRRLRVVLGTNPNPTESGSFGLGIQSVKGSESLSPDPDPGSVARFSKLTNNFGKFDSSFN